MRTALALAILGLLTACSTPSVPQPEAPPEPAATEPVVVDTTTHVLLTPLTGTALRYDGVYLYRSGELSYYMRFFERGNVALVAGPEKDTEPTSNSIRQLLVQDVQSGTENVHNTPVIIRNDSLHFRTMALKGAIEYTGVAHGDSLIVEKVSRINGKRAILTYRFLPDGQ